MHRFFGAGRYPLDFLNNEGEQAVVKGYLMLLKPHPVHKKMVETMCGDLYTFRSPTKPAIICGSLVPVPLPSLGGPAGHKPRPSLEETSAHSIYFPSCAGSYQRV